MGEGALSTYQAGVDEVGENLAFEYVSPFLRSCKQPHKKGEIDNGKSSIAGSGSFGLATGKKHSIGNGEGFVR